MDAGLRHLSERTLVAKTRNGIARALYLKSCLLSLEAAGNTLWRQAGVVHSVNSLLILSCSLSIPQATEVSVLGFELVDVGLGCLQGPPVLLRQ